MSGKRNEEDLFDLGNTVSNILEEGHVKSIMKSQRACNERLMTVDEVKEVRIDRLALFSLNTPLGI